MSPSATPLADVVTDSLSGIARALEVPVHVLAVLLLLVLALELGRFATESWRRARPGRTRLLELAARALAEPARSELLARDASSSLAELAIEDMARARAAGREEAVEHALADYELGVQRRLDRTRMLVRAGPSVGLMGTLIPLAPGLGALGRGDFQALADDLQVAFAATVIGILVGTGAFALTLVRTRFYTEDLAALERAVAASPPRDPVGVGGTSGPGGPGGSGGPGGPGGLGGLGVLAPAGGEAGGAPAPAPESPAPHARVTESVGDHST
jgi:biopolymer transport protein ExbB/TolQ